MTKRVKQLIALVLALSFSVMEVAYAAPYESIKAGEIPLQVISEDVSRLEAPAEYTTLREIHKGNQGILIIHFQDAHSNLSGQQNMANALDALMSKYGISLILSEGGSNDCSLTPIKNIAPPEVWKRIAKSYLVQGKITGEEYLNLVSDHPMKIMGIEDIALYVKSVSHYADLADKREEILDYLKAIQISLNKLKRKLYPADLIAYEDKKKNGSGNGSANGNGNGNGSFETSFKDLLELAQTRKIDLSEFPNIMTLVELQLKEKLIDFDAANLEQAALAEEIAKKGGGEDLKAHLEKMNQMKGAKVSQYAYFQNTFRMAEQKNISLVKYPNLQRYVEYLSDFSELDLDQVLDELTKAEDKVYLHVIASEAKQSMSTEDARLVRAIDRFLALLKTAYNIQMSTKEFELFKVNEPDFGTLPYLAFINRKLAEAGYFEDLVPYKNLLEEGKKSLTAFYDSVGQRDHAFIQNTERILKQENQKVAVLISGGYHTPHLKTLFQEKGYSYAVLTPLVTAETNQKKYESRLLAPIRPEVKKVQVIQGAGKADKSLSALEKDLMKTKQKGNGVRAVLIALETNQELANVDKNSDLGKYLTDLNKFTETELEVLITTVVQTDNPEIGDAELKAKVTEALDAIRAVQKRELAPAVLGARMAGQVTATPIGPDQVSQGNLVLLVRNEQNELTPVPAEEVFLARGFKLEVTRQLNDQGDVVVTGINLRRPHDPQSVPIPYSALSFHPQDISVVAFNLPKEGPGITVEADGGQERTIYEGQIRLPTEVKETKGTERLDKFEVIIPKTTQPAGETQEVEITPPEGIALPSRPTFTHSLLGGISQALAKGMGLPPSTQVLGIKPFRSETGSVVATVTVTIPAVGERTYYLKLYPLEMQGKPGHVLDEGDAKWLSEVFKEEGIQFEEGQSLSYGELFTIREYLRMKKFRDFLAAKGRENLLPRFSLGALSSEEAGSIGNQIGKSVAEQLGLGANSPVLITEPAAGSEFNDFVDNLKTIKDPYRRFEIMLRFANAAVGLADIFRTPTPISYIDPQTGKETEAVVTLAHADLLGEIRPRQNGEVGSFLDLGTSAVVPSDGVKNFDLAKFLLDMDLGGAFKPGIFAHPSHLKSGNPKMPLQKFISILAVKEDGTDRYVNLADQLGKLKTGQGPTSGMNPFQLDDFSIMQMTLAELFMNAFLLDGVGEQAKKSLMDLVRNEIENFFEAANGEAVNGYETYDQEHTRPNANLDRLRKFIERLATGLERARQLSALEGQGILVTDVNGKRYAGEVHVSSAGSFEVVVAGSVLDVFSIHSISKILSRELVRAKLEQFRDGSIEVDGFDFNGGGIAAGRIEGQHIIVDGDVGFPDSDSSGLGVNLNLTVYTEKAPNEESLPKLSINGWITDIRPAKGRKTLDELRARIFLNSERFKQRQSLEKQRLAERSGTHPLPVASPQQVPAAVPTPVESPSAAAAREFNEGLTLRMRAGLSFNLQVGKESISIQRVVATKREGASVTVYEMVGNEIHPHSFNFDSQVVKISTAPSYVDSEQLFETLYRASQLNRAGHSAIVDLEVTDQYGVRTMKVNRGQINNVVAVREPRTGQMTDLSLNWRDGGFNSKGLWLPRSGEFPKDLVYLKGGEILYGSPALKLEQWETRSNNVISNFRNSLLYAAHHPDQFVEVAYQSNTLEPGSYTFFKRGILTGIEELGEGVMVLRFKDGMVAGHSGAPNKIEKGGASVKLNTLSLKGESVSFPEEFPSTWRPLSRGMVGTNLTSAKKEAAERLLYLAPIMGGLHSLNVGIVSDFSISPDDILQVTSSTGAVTTVDLNIQKVTRIAPISGARMAVETAAQAKPAEETSANGFAAAQDTKEQEEKAPELLKERLDEARRGDFDRIVEEIRSHEIDRQVLTAIFGKIENGEPLGSVHWEYLNRLDNQLAGHLPLVLLRINVKGGYRVVVVDQRFIKELNTILGPELNNEVIAERQELEGKLLKALLGKKEEETLDDEVVGRSYKRDDYALRPGVDLGRDEWDQFAVEVSAGIKRFLAARFKDLFGPGGKYEGFEVPVFYGISDVVQEESEAGKDNSRLNAYLQALQAARRAREMADTDPNVKGASYDQEYFDRLMEEADTRAAGLGITVDTATDEVIYTKPGTTERLTPEEAQKFEDTIMEVRGRSEKELREKSGTNSKEWRLKRYLIIMDMLDFSKPWISKNETEAYARRDKIMELREKIGSLKDRAPPSMNPEERSSLASALRRALAIVQSSVKYPSILDGKQFNLESARRTGSIVAADAVGFYLTVQKNLMVAHRKYRDYVTRYQAEHDGAMPPLLERHNEIRKLAFEADDKVKEQMSAKKDDLKSALQQSGLVIPSIKLVDGTTADHMSADGGDEINAFVEWDGASKPLSDEELKVRLEPLVRAAQEKGLRISIANHKGPAQANILASESEEAISDFSRRFTDVAGPYGFKYQSTVDADNILKNLIKTLNGQGVGVKAAVIYMDEDEQGLPRTRVLFLDNMGNVQIQLHSREIGEEEFKYKLATDYWRAKGAPKDQDDESKAQDWFAAVAALRRIKSTSRPDEFISAISEGLKAVRGESAQNEGMARALAKKYAPYAAFLREKSAGPVVGDISVEYQASTEKLIFKNTSNNWIFEVDAEETDEQIIHIPVDTADPQNAQAFTLFLKKEGGNFVITRATGPDNETLEAQLPQVIATGARMAAQAGQAPAALAVSPEKTFVFGRAEGAPFYLVLRRSVERGEVRYELVVERLPGGGEAPAVARTIQVDKDTVLVVLEKPVTIKTMNGDEVSLKAFEILIPSSLQKDLLTKPVPIDNANVLDLDYENLALAVNDFYFRPLVQLFSKNKYNSTKISRELQGMLSNFSDRKEFFERVFDPGTPGMPSELQKAALALRNGLRERNDVDRAFLEWLSLAEQRHYQYDELLEGLLKFLAEAPYSISPALVYSAKNYTEQMVGHTRTVILGHYFEKAGVDAKVTPAVSADQEDIYEEVNVVTPQGVATIKKRNLQKGGMTVVFPISVKTSADEPARLYAGLAPQAVLGRLKDNHPKGIPTDSKKLDNIFTSRARFDDKIGDFLLEVAFFIRYARDYRDRVAWVPSESYLDDLERMAGEVWQWRNSATPAYRRSLIDQVRNLKDLHEAIEALKEPGKQETPQLQQLKKDYTEAENLLKEMRAPLDKAKGRLEALRSELTKGKLFLVQQYFPSTYRDLGSRIDKSDASFSGPENRQRLTRLVLARSLVEELRAVHSSGIVHRDVKPGNFRVYLAPGTTLQSALNSRVHLFDWGLALKPASADDLASKLEKDLSYLFAGTPEYFSEEFFGRNFYSLAPEQKNLVYQELNNFGRDATAAGLVVLELFGIDPFRRGPDFFAVYDKSVSIAVDKNFRIPSTKPWWLIQAQIDQANHLTAEEKEFLKQNITPNLSDPRLANIDAYWQGLEIALDQMISSIISGARMAVETAAPSQQTAANIVYKAPFPLFIKGLQVTQGQYLPFSIENEQGRVLSATPNADGKTFTVQLAEPVTLDRSDGGAPLSNVRSFTVTIPNDALQSESVRIKEVSNPQVEAPITPENKAINQIYALMSDTRLRADPESWDLLLDGRWAGVASKAAEDKAYTRELLVLLRNLQDPDLNFSKRVQTLYSFIQRLVKQSGDGEAIKFLELNKDKIIRGVEVKELLTNPDNNYEIGRGGMGRILRISKESPYVVKIPIDEGYSDSLGDPERVAQSVLETIALQRSELISEHGFGDLGEAEKLAVRMLKGEGEPSDEDKKEFKTLASRWRNYQVMGYLESSRFLNVLVNNKDENSPEQWSELKQLEFFQALSSRLEFMHGAGIIHRDLKPANIWVDKKGNPMLLDFGLAKIESGEGSELSMALNEPGPVKGTPGYMSQRRASGDPGDENSDWDELAILMSRVLFPGDIAVLKGRNTPREQTLAIAIDVRSEEDLWTETLKNATSEYAQNMKQIFRSLRDKKAREEAFRNAILKAQEREAAGKSGVSLPTAQEITSNGTIRSALFTFSWFSTLAASTFALVVAPMAFLGVLSVAMGAITIFIIGNTLRRLDQEWEKAQSRKRLSAVMPGDFFERAEWGEVPTTAGARMAVAAKVAAKQLAPEAKLVVRKKQISPFTNFMLSNKAFKSLYFYVGLFASVFPMLTFGLGIYLSWSGPWFWNRLFGLPLALYSPLFLMAATGITNYIRYGYFKRRFERELTEALKAGVNTEVGSAQFRRAVAAVEGIKHVMVNLAMIEFKQGKKESTGINKSFIDTISLAVDFAMAHKDTPDFISLKKGLLGLLTYLRKRYEYYQRFLDWELEDLDKLRDILTGRTRTIEVVGGGVVRQHVDELGVVREITRTKVNALQPIIVDGIKQWVAQKPREGGATLTIRTGPHDYQVIGTVPLDVQDGKLVNPDEIGNKLYSLLTAEKPVTDFEIRGKGNAATLTLTVPVGQVVDRPQGARMANVESIANDVLQRIRQSQPAAGMKDMQLLQALWTMKAGADVGNRDDVAFVEKAISDVNSRRPSQEKILKGWVQWPELLGMIESKISFKVSPSIDLPLTFSNLSEEEYRFILAMSKVLQAEPARRKEAAKEAAQSLDKKTPLPLPTNAVVAAYIKFLKQHESQKQSASQAELVNLPYNQARALLGNELTARLSQSGMNPLAAHNEAVKYIGERGKEKISVMARLNNGIAFLEALSRFGGDKGMAARKVMKGMVMVLQGSVKGKEFKDGAFEAAIGLLTNRDVDPVISTADVSSYIDAWRSHQVDIGQFNMEPRNTNFNQTRMALGAAFRNALSAKGIGEDLAIRETSGLFDNELTKLNKITQNFISLPQQTAKSGARMAHGVSPAQQAEAVYALPSDFNLRVKLVESASGVYETAITRTIEGQEEMLASVNNGNGTFTVTLENAVNLTDPKGAVSVTSFIVTMPPGLKKLKPGESVQIKEVKLPLSAIGPGWSKDYSVDGNLRIRVGKTFVNAAMVGNILFVSERQRGMHGTFGQPITIGRGQNKMPRYFQILDPAISRDPHVEITLTQTLDGPRIRVHNLTGKYLIAAEFVLDETMKKTILEDLLKKARNRSDPVSVGQLQEAIAMIQSGNVKSAGDATWGVTPVREFVERELGEHAANADLLRWLFENLKAQAKLEAQAGFRAGIKSFQDEFSNIKKNYPEVGLPYLEKDELDGVLTQIFRLSAALEKDPLMRELGEYQGKIKRLLNEWRLDYFNLSTLNLVEAVVVAREKGEARGAGVLSSDSASKITPGIARAYIEAVNKLKPEDFDGLVGRLIDKSSTRRDFSKDIKELKSPEFIEAMDRLAARIQVGDPDRRGGNNVVKRIEKGIVYYGPRNILLDRDGKNAPVAITSAINRVTLEGRRETPPAAGARMAAMKILNISALRRDEKLVPNFETAKNGILNQLRTQGVDEPGLARVSRALEDLKRSHETSAVGPAEKGLYHDFYHTLEVTLDAVHNAVVAGLTGNIVEEIALAAIYHDMAVIEQGSTIYSAHEELSAKIANDKLQNENVVRMILMTQFAGDFFKPENLYKALNDAIVETKKGGLQFESAAKPEDVVGMAFQSKEAGDSLKKGSAAIAIADLKSALSSEQYANRLKALFDEYNVSDNANPKESTFLANNGWISAYDAFAGTTGFINFGLLAKGAGRLDVFNSYLGENVLSDEELQNFKVNQALFELLNKPAVLGIQLRQKGPLTKADETALAAMFEEPSEFLPSIRAHILNNPSVLSEESASVVRNFLDLIEADAMLLQNKPLTPDLLAYLQKIRNEPFYAYDAHRILALSNSPSVNDLSLARGFFSKEQDNAKGLGNFLDQAKKARQIKFHQTRLEAIGELLSDVENKLAVAVQEEAIGREPLKGAETLKETSGAPTIAAKGPGVTPTALPSAPAVPATGARMAAPTVAATVPAFAAVVTPGGAPAPIVSFVTLYNVGVPEIEIASFDRVGPDTLRLLSQAASKNRGIKEGRFVFSFGVPEGEVPKGQPGYFVFQISPQNGVQMVDPEVIEGGKYLVLDTRPPPLAGTFAMQVGAGIEGVLPLAEVKPGMMEKGESTQTIVDSVLGKERWALKQIDQIFTGRGATGKISLPPGKIGAIISYINVEGMSEEEIGKAVEARMAAAKVIQSKFEHGLILHQIILAAEGKLQIDKRSDLLPETEVVMMYYGVESEGLLAKAYDDRAGAIVTDQTKNKIDGTYNFYPHIAGMGAAIVVAFSGDQQAISYLRTLTESSIDTEGISLARNVSQAPEEDRAEARLALLFHSKGLVVQKIKAGVYAVFLQAQELITRAVGAMA